MAKKTSKKTDGGSLKMVTLYAVGLPPREFNKVHAARLLKRPNTKWAISPWPGMPEAGKKSPLASGNNGTSNTSANPGTNQEEE